MWKIKIMRFTAQFIEHLTGTHTGAPLQGLKYILFGKTASGCRGRHPLHRQRSLCLLEFYRDKIHRLWCIIYYADVCIFRRGSPAWLPVHTSKYNKIIRIPHNSPQNIITAVRAITRTAVIHKTELIFVLAQNVVFEEKSYCPKTGKTDNRKNDSAENRQLSAEKRTDNIKAENAYAAPVYRADNC